METNGQKKPATNVIAQLEDTNIVTFLKMLGWEIRPWIEDNPDVPPEKRRVSFAFYGNVADAERFGADVKRFYANEKVGILDFVRCLKDVKSEMYNMRRLNKI